ncbi:hypothetical protein [Escherichia phage ZL19]|uniref:Uncharacterized protein n=1 Tax=Escherichia phage ZL19 TaxID=2914037 RepID=A0A9E6Z524_9CAUD|nr:hypothetical protein [Escherichia phage ZL19]
MNKKDKLRHECALIGLNEDYTDLVVRGKLDIDLARQFQSEDELLCCDGLGCAECLPFI